MESDMLKLIDDLISGFDKKGYTRLRNEISKKRKTFLNKSREVNDENKRVIELKKIFTRIMDMVYEHTKIGIQQAEDQFNMLDESKSFFNKFGYSEEQIIIDYRNNLKNLNEIKKRYIGFGELRQPLNKLILRAEKKGYLINSRSVEQINGGKNNEN